MPGQDSVPSSGRCVIRPTRGRALKLSSHHLIKFGNFEDRTAQWSAFVGALVQRVARANPQTMFLAGMPAGLWWTWVGLLVLMVGVTILAVLMAGSLMIDGRLVSFDFFFALLYVVSALGGAVSIVNVLMRGRGRRFQPQIAGDAPA